MSFILKNNPTVINIKLTNVGRQLLSQGRLTMTKWAVGDSEIDYGFNSDISFDAFMANILRPKDNNPTFLSHILQNSDDEESIYTALPTVVSNTNILTNSATERGFFSITGSSASLLTNSFTMKQADMQVNIATVAGGTSLTIRKSPSYLANITEPAIGDYLLVKWANPLITGGTVSAAVSEAIPYIWYKIENIVSGALSTDNLVITVDKPLPNFNGEGGSIAAGAFLYPNNNNREISGDSIQTYYSTPYVTDFIEESVIAFLENCICPVRDVPVWNMAIVFTEEVAGVASTDRNYSQYYSKSFGGFVRYIERLNPEIKKIGIIHFSNASPSNHYGEGLFEDTPVLELPTIMWHYETGGTIGLKLTCDSTAKVLSGITATYHDLVDRFGNVVGKVFNDLKIFVIEDQELLFAMSYKANRNWTLPRATIGFNLSACEPVNNMFNMSFVINNPTSSGVSDGKITVFVSNAIEPVYSINGGVSQASNVFTNLGTGTYTIVVTDNFVPAPNNTLTDTVEITLTDGAVTFVNNS